MSAVLAPARSAAVRSTSSSCCCARCTLLRRVLQVLGDVAHARGADAGGDGVGRLGGLVEEGGRGIHVAGDGRRALRCVRCRRARQVGRELARVVRWSPRSPHCSSSRLAAASTSRRRNSPNAAVSSVRVRWARSHSAITCRVHSRCWVSDSGYASSSCCLSRNASVTFARADVTASANCRERSMPNCAIAKPSSSSLSRNCSSSCSSRLPARVSIDGMSRPAAPRERRTPAAAEQYGEPECDQMRRSRRPRSREPRQRTAQRRGCPCSYSTFAPTSGPGKGVR